MNEKIKEKINLIAAKIDIIESINNALLTSLLGENTLTQKDAYNIIYLLKNRIKDLKSRQNKLIKKLKI